MSRLKEIKNRIDSVKKTQKITRAMKMVAAANFKRAAENALKSRPYLQALDTLLKNVTLQTEPDNLPLLMRPSPSSRQAILVISSDRGLCGAFNTAVIRLTDTFLRSQQDPVDLYFFGTKAYRYFHHKGIPIRGHYPALKDTITLMAAHSLLHDPITQFKTGAIGKLWLFYNEFGSALAGRLVQKQLLPFDPGPPSQTEPGSLSDFIYEPGREILLDSLITDHVEFSFYKALLESRAAEEAARMTAMDAASENATDMIKELTLTYNRRRQAHITREITEIVAGAEALRG